MLSPLISSCCGLFICIFFSIEVSVCVYFLLLRVTSTLLVCLCLVHGLYSPWDHKQSDTTERLSLFNAGHVAKTEER